MKRRWPYLLLVLLLAGCGRTAPVAELCVVPEPVFMVQREGSFTLPRNPRLSVVGMGQNAATVKYIMQSLRHAHMHPRLVATTENNDMVLSLNDTVNPELGDEGYLLEVRTGGVSLRANTEAGLFYGYQTLLQMLPSDVTEVSYRSIALPECTVLDRPRFAWRGVQMDASHYAFSPKAMRRWVDLLASYKMNRLHLRLNAGDDTYTAEDLAALADYAAVRGVRVVPELCDTVASDSLLALFGLAADALPTLCHDRGEALEQARHGAQVVVCPDDCFDLATGQADRRYQPPSAEGTTTLAQVYAFDPAPVGTNSHVVANLLGGTALLGTELVGSLQQAEYMLLPRMLAVSECLWTPAAGKDWMRFRRKVEEHKERLAERGYAYCEGSFTPHFAVRRVDEKTVNVAITTEVPNTYIFYTTDMSAPTRESSIYVGPVNLRRGTHIKILPVYKDIERDSVYEFVIK